MKASNMTLLLLASIALVASDTSADDRPAATSTAAASRPVHSAVVAAPRTDDWWKSRDARFSKRAAEGDIELIFLGDSITEGWESAGKEAWQKHFGARKAVNMGIGGDRTQHVLWRLDHGNLAGLDKPARPGMATPKLVVLMIGTNNSNANDNTAAEIADGICAIVQRLRDRLPGARVLLLAIFPRGEKPDAQRAKNAEASRLAAARVADGKTVHYMDIGDKFTRADKSISGEIMPDMLHLSPRGYELWAEAIEPKVRELLAADSGQPTRQRP